MLLRTINENSFPITPTPLQKEFQKRLDEGRVMIFYQINASLDTIYYIGNDEDFGTFKIKITDDGKFEFGKHFYISATNNKAELDNLYYTFFRYLIRRDKVDSEEKLKKRYGRLYNDRVLLSGMSYDEMLRYKEDREGLSNLLDELKTVRDNEKMTVDNSVLYGCYSICLEYEPSCPNDLNILVYDKKQRPAYHGGFQTYYKHFFTEIPEVLTPIQKEIFMILTPLYIDTLYNYDFYGVNCDRIISSVFKILPLMNKQEKCYVHPIVIRGQDYTLSDEIQTLEVSIDENGNIKTNFPDGYHYYLCEELKRILAVDYVHQKLSLYRYSSPKVLKLFLFKMKHPNFSTKYFMDDIKATLIPNVKDQVPVETTLLAKSMMSTDHIAYYVDLDKETMQLSCNSKYCLDKNYVSCEEFKNRYPDRYQGFHLALSFLSMKESGIVKDPDTIVQFISSSLDQLRNYAQLFISEDIKKLHKKPVGRINVVIASRNDWFSLNFNSDEYTKEEVNSILDAYKKKKKYYLLKGDILSLDEDDNNTVKEIIEELDFKKKNIPIYQALKLTDKKNIDLSEPIKQLFYDISHYEKEELSLSDTLQSKLRPYQIKGVQWLTALKNHHLSGVLADDMGLGKTLEMIAFLSQYDEKKPNLIITPKSLTFNWEDEFHHWVPDAKVVVLSLDKEERHSLISQIKKDETVNYIISYDSLRIDQDLFKDISFGFVILDEGQNIANALSQKARAVKTLNADYKFALTGTPIQNSLMDLWSLFDFLMPGYLKSFNDFKKQYAKYEIDAKERKHLEHIISPFLLKRKKDDVLIELPGKTVVTQSIVMEQKEKDLYHAYLIKAKNTFQEIGEGGTTKKVEVLAALTRLRQICVDPSSFLEYPDISSKLDYTLFLVKEAISKGHKVLVFSSFRMVLLHLGELLGKENITFDFITGDTSAQNRLQLAKTFNQDENPKVMLISLKAGGTGLNLIGADIVLHLDPWWNLAAEDQASDRAYRIGQNRKVTIYKVVMKDTIEEKVLALQEKKKNLSDIFDNATEKSNLNDEDIAYLLS